MAVAAWTGLWLDFLRVDAHLGSASASLWSMLRYFTITTNVAIGVAFTALALGLPPSALPRRLAGLSLSILLVGVVFKVMLEGLAPLGFGNLLLHRATPILVPLYWCAFVPKGHLRGTDPLLWLLYPLGYLAYALLRGGHDGHYPYPFLDLTAIGPERLAINALVIGTGFLITGVFCVWADRMLGRHSRETQA